MLLGGTKNKESCEYKVAYYFNFNFYFTKYNVHDFASFVCDSSWKKEKITVNDLVNNYLRILL